MFEKHHEKKLEKEHEEALAKWQAERDGYAELLQLAETFNGLPTKEIVLGPGEALFYKIAGAALLDARSTGHWEGASSGFSVPIGGGVRYRVGATHGHYVQGEPVLAAIDHGTVYVTNRRVSSPAPNRPERSPSPSSSASSTTTRPARLPFRSPTAKSPSPSTTGPASRRTSTSASTWRWLTTGARQKPSWPSFGRTWRGSTRHAHRRRRSPTEQQGACKVADEIWRGLEPTPSIPAPLAQVVEISTSRSEN